MKPAESLEPSRAEQRRIRRRLTLGGELTLALVPTATVLLVFAFVEVLTQQRLLFASLASSAFLIYLDPEHGTNSVRTLAIAQLGAAAAGFVAHALIGPNYWAAAAAMVTTIVLMIFADVVHPPAVATALAFGFRTGDERNIVMFALAVGLIVLLVMLQRSMLWTLTRLRARESQSGG